jgi:LysM repeat protein
MKYIKPHLSPELRAQITPHNRRDRRLAMAGVIFLVLTVVLTINLLPKGGRGQNVVQLPNPQTSTENTTNQDKQVLGLSTKEEVTPSTSHSEQFTLYTVKNGDTLFNISQEYNIQWDLIAQMNNLSEPYVLHAGQQLKIPQATTSKVPNKIYTIKSGDTLASIAKEFNVTVADIIAVNPNLQKSDLITVGQVIKLP